MPKELGGSGSSAGVFGLLGERSSYYDDSYVPLSSPPSSATLAPPPASPASGKMKRSASQPSITGAESGQASVSLILTAPQPTTVDDMRLAQGLVAKSAITNLLPSSTDYNSLAVRYDTSPHYSSSKILSSFHDEFQQFSQKNKTFGRSASAPSSPRGSRSQADEMLLAAAEESRPRLSSDSKSVRKTMFSGLIGTTGSRKLSFVTEEQGDVGSGDRSGKEVVRCATGVQKPVPNNIPDSHVVVPPTDTVDAQKLPITRQVIGWFRGPGHQVTVSQNELNAFSPSSF